MTDEEAACYVDRYADLAKYKKKPDELVEKAQDHYLKWGYFEGRHRYVGQRITNN